MFHPWTGTTCPRAISSPNPSMREHRHSLPKSVSTSAMNRMSAEYSELLATCSRGRYAGDPDSESGMIKGGKSTRSSRSR